MMRLKLSLSVLTVIALSIFIPLRLTAEAAGHGQGKLLVVSFIDIGQGDAELIETPSGKRILVDSGPPEGQTALLKYLNQRGVTKFDMVMSSHPHRDHIGNSDTILTTFPTAVVYDSGYAFSGADLKHMLAVIKAKNIPFVNVGAKGLAGTNVNLGDGVNIRFLNPRLPYLSNTSDPNNNSIVFKLSMGTTSVLFTGDQELAERTRLLNTKEDLTSTVYKVAHHGSFNGTDDPFMARVKPKEAVISCAVGNSFGHPHKKALDALASAKARVWRTDTMGTVVLVTDGTNYNMKTLGK
jgi:beta-lactamase superfamily II metal-dependent hydrolase